MAAEASIPAALHDVVEQLARTGWAAELVDDQWCLVWMSDAFRTVLGGASDEELGIGKLAVEARDGELWRRVASRDGYLESVRQLAPTLLHDVDRETLTANVPDDVRAVIDEAEPGEPFTVWTSAFGWRQEGMPEASVGYVGVRLRDDDGHHVGTVFIYGPDLPAPLLALVARGDPRMFERMADLFDPAARATAILFADIESSGRLSRHLPTSAYFELVREIRTTVDAAVIERHGIVGKHAGDGVSAFFIAEQLESESATARAAIEAGRAICDGAEDAARRVSDHGAPVNVEDVCINVGMHWGAALYVGQIVTGGRLEVTAMGDEVNEAARIEQSAKDGAVLASKALVERLEPDDAEALGIDPEAVVYRSVDELSGADDKAIRDAGAVAVTDVRAGAERSG